LLFLVCRSATRLQHACPPLACTMAAASSSSVAGRGTGGFGASASWRAAPR
jgi:hypothetical protein